MAMQREGGGEKEKEEKRRETIKKNAQRLFVRCFFSIKQTGSRMMQISSG